MSVYNQDTNRGAGVDIGPNAGVRGLYNTVRLLIFFYYK